VKIIAHLRISASPLRAKRFGLQIAQCLGNIESPIATTCLSAHGKEKIKGQVEKCARPSVAFYAGDFCVKWCRLQEAFPEIKGVANQGVYRQAVRHDVSPHCISFRRADGTWQYVGRVAAAH
jgi:hypothetical protein